MKIEPFETQEVQEKRMTTAEEDITGLDMRMTVEEGKATALKSTSDMLICGVKNINVSGTLGNPVWWRIAELPTRLNFIILLNTNCFTPDGTGGYIGFHALKIDRISTKARIAKLVDTFRWAPIDFEKARLVYNDAHTYLEIYTPRVYKSAHTNATYLGAGADAIKVMNIVGNTPARIFSS